MRNKNESRKTVKENIISEKENAGYGATKYDISSKKSLYKSIRRFVLCVVLILVVIFTGSVLFVTVKTNYYLAKQTDEYNIRADDIKTDLKNNLKAVNDNFIVDAMKTVFTDDDIYVFTYNLWTYDLYVNEKKITSTDSLEINKDDKIYIKEIQKKSTLPDSFINLGNLTRGDVNDSLKNHFSLKGESYIIKVDKEGLVNTYTLTETTFEPGDKFKIVFSDQFARKLNFDKDVIAVTVKG